MDLLDHNLGDRHCADLVASQDVVRRDLRLLRTDGEAWEASGLKEAVKVRDTPALFDWLMTGFSFQGISDRIAW